VAETAFQTKQRKQIGKDREWTPTMVIGSNSWKRTAVAQRERIQLGETWERKDGDGEIYRATVLEATTDPRGRRGYIVDGWAPCRQ
jgi:hypothetical protein